MAAYRYLQAPDGETVSVKSGFSWLAFLFGPIWAIFKGLWPLSFWLILSYGALLIIDEVYVQGTKNIVLIFLMTSVYFVYMLFCGKRGHGWVVADFERKGYKHVTASNV